MILVIDNYDSFVHNVARYFALAGATTKVVRNDAVDVADIERLQPDAIVISPGPCTPAEAGISCAALEHFSGRIPVLGICLGHQCLGAIYDGTVSRARRPMHGLASPIIHDGTRLFAGLPSPLMVGRYHSLIVEPSDTLLKRFTVDAVSDEGEVMAMSHRSHPTYGVQFHPESVLTPQGLALFENFLRLAKAWSGRVLA